MGLITSIENVLISLVQRYRWWHTPLLLLAFFLLCCALAWWYQRAELERRYAEMRAAGHPVTLEELDDYYALPEGTEDNTELWLEALRLVAQTESDPNAKTLPIIGDGPAIPSLNQPWIEQEAVAAFLEHHSETLTAIHTAVEAGSSVRFPHKFSEGFAMEFPELELLRECARLLTLETHCRARTGDVRGAIESILATFDTASTMDREPLLVSYLIRLSVDSVAIENAAQLLPSMEPTADQLRAIQQALRGAHYKLGLERAMVGERTIAMIAYSDLSSIDQSPIRVNFYQLFVPSAKSTYYDLTRDGIAATRQPWHVAISHEYMPTDWRPKTWNPGEALGSLLVPAVDVCLYAGARLRAKTLSLDTAVAAELNRRELGAFPQTLDELIPDHLPTIPIDPFDGKPLRYRIEDDGIVVYSIGRNKVDDLGDIELDTKLNEFPDLGVRFKLEAPAAEAP